MVNVPVKLDRKWNPENLRPIDLIPHKRNPRRITEQRFRMLQKSIIEEGFRVPPTIDNDGVLLAGHQRIRALIDLGLGEEPIPVMVPNFQLTDYQRRRIIASDNVSHGEDDTDILAADNSVEELLDWGYDKRYLRDIAAMDKMPQVEALPEDEDRPKKKVEFFAGEKKPKTCPHCGGEVP